MNWTGGARSRVQNKLKHRAQQEFFKKRRLESTLEAHKTQWPEVEGGQDLQRLNMFSKHIAASSTEQDNKAPVMTTPGYSRDEDPLPVNDEPRSQGSYYNPEWLQVTCEEGQTSITLPRYDDDDGLIPGVDFPEDEESLSPQGLPDFTATSSYSQQIAPNHMFTWSAVQSNEHPVPKSAPDPPETPSVRWAIRQHPQGRPTWSLQSSDTASCSSFTPCTSSYRGSPQSGSSAAMTIPARITGTPASNREMPRSLQRIALHGRNTPQPGLLSNPSIPNTPAITYRSFAPQTPAPTRRPSSLQQIKVQGNRTPYASLQQTRTVLELPMTGSPSLAGRTCFKDMREKKNKKDLVDFQQTMTQGKRTSQSCYQGKIDTFDAPRSNSSLSQGQNFHRIDARNRTESPGNQGIDVQEEKGTRHSLQHNIHEGEPPKDRAVSETIEDHHKDLQNRSSETVHVQHGAEQNTGTPISALRCNKTMPKITAAPADPKHEAVLDAPIHFYKDKPPFKSPEVAPKSTNVALEYPSVSEMRNMESFYRSAWVLGLQRRHQELFMEEIKAQITYKPTDRFSIMSAFEDSDDPFMGHKSRSSSLPYRTLDDQLHASAVSTSSSNSSQHTARHTETRCDTRRQSCDTRRLSREGYISGKDSTSEKKQHSQPNSRRSSHQHVVPAECTGHVVPVEVAPTPSEAPIFKPLSSQDIGKQESSQENLSPKSDRRKMPNLATMSSVSKSESGTPHGDKKESSILPSLSADFTAAQHSESQQQVSANEFKDVDSLCKPSMMHCRCGELKDDKACQAQPDVSTVSTSCDE